MKTGNTRLTLASQAVKILASMEPGHEDREYRAGRPRIHANQHASMEPGHEDREYQEHRHSLHPQGNRLNGARS